MHTVELYDPVYLGVCLYFEQWHRLKGYWQVNH